MNDLNKINEQTTLKQTQILRTDRWLPRGKGVGEVGKKGKGIKKYKWWLQDSPGYVNYGIANRVGQ